jgi:multicomponent Na+:H+ antiporter subunit D
MVELGIYAVARLYWVIFAGRLGPHAAALRAILVAAGTATALLGAWMCFVQRHIKRLLAFSTISHVGVFLCAIGLLSAPALAGAAVCIVAHGLTKAALFMGCGVLLHRFATVDEFDLHGRGRAIPAAGAVFAAGGLLLAAAPPFTAFAGKSLIEHAASGLGYGWLAVLFALVSALTGGAVLRVSGRVFLGWGPAQGPDPRQARAAEERVDETRDTRDHTPPLMLAVPAVLLVCAAAIGLVPGAVPLIERLAAQFAMHRAYAAWVLHGIHAALPKVSSDHVAPVELASALAGVAGALGLAAVGLFGRPLRERLPTASTGAARDWLHALRRLHSGHIGDYIAWWTAGAGAFRAACLLALR